MKQMTAPNWQPMHEQQLLTRIEQELTGLSDAQRNLWQWVRLPRPDIWQQHPVADEGCGFWVVAVFGRHCIYFNDISDGFAISSFQRWRDIDHYQPQASHLQELLERMLPCPTAIA